MLVFQIGPLWKNVRFKFPMSKKTDIQTKEFFIIKRLMKWQFFCFKTEKLVFILCYLMPASI